MSQNILKIIFIFSFLLASCWKNAENERVRGTVTIQDIDHVAHVSHSMFEIKFPDVAFDRNHAKIVLNFYPNIGYCQTCSGLGCRTKFFEPFLKTSRAAYGGDWDYKVKSEMDNGDGFATYCDPTSQHFWVEGHEFKVEGWDLFLGQKRVHLAQNSLRRFTITKDSQVLEGATR